MKNLSISIACLLLLIASTLCAGKEIEVEIGHGHLSPDHLLLQTGDKIMFTNVVHMEGGHSIGIDGAEETVISPAMKKGEQWTYEFKDAGNFTFFVLEHPGVRGKATVFTEDKMRLAVSDLRKEMVSYSIGYDFGLQVVKKLDNLDLRLFVAGLQHAYNDEDPKLDEGEMEFIIADYKREIVRRVKAKFDKMAKKNLDESTEYFARNKQNAGVVFLGNGLQYKVLRKGHGKKPIIGDKVKVHYKGTFLNGVEFDNTYSTGVSEFVLTLQVLPGIVEGLKLMSEGSKWQLFVPPHLGYGKKGQRYVDKEHLSIEPNTTLLFEIELVEVVGEHLISGDRQTNNK